jgi:hypothetical protein
MWSIRRSIRFRRAVGPAVERLRDGARRGGRDDGLDAASPQPAAETVHVISLVGDEAPGRGDGAEQARRHGDVGHISRRRREGDRSAATIGQEVDLGRAAAARAPDRPPFPTAAERCAFTCELSSSNSVGTSPDAATRSNRRCQTPRCDHLL